MSNVIPRRGALSPPGDPWLGQYGAAEAPCTVYESAGRLWLETADKRNCEILGERSDRLRLGPQGHEAVRFWTDGDTAMLQVGGDRLPRRDFGAQALAAVRGGLRASPAVLRATALAADPPAEPAPARSSELVDLRRLHPGLRFDIRYATADNFMGFPLYDQPGAYLQAPAAQALARVQASLEREGYGLLIYDAYRPWFVTRMFWDATPPEQHMFVADPARGSRHNRGCAVDLTLWSRATGEAVAMTSEFDEFSTRSYADFVGGTSEQRAQRQRLRTAMEAQGFAVLPTEWWHFDYQDWPRYGIGTAGFAELGAP